MVGVLSFLWLLSVGAFILSIIFLVIRAAKKQRKKPVVIMASSTFILSFVLMTLVSLLYEPSEKSVSTLSQNTVTDQSEPKSSNNADKSALEYDTDTDIKQTAAETESTDRQAKQEKDKREKEAQEKAEKAAEQKAKREAEEKEKAELERAEKEKAEKEKTEYMKQENAVESNSDLEIITRNEHPTYYGSVEQSHAVWDDVKDGKVVFADGYDKYQDNTILIMDAYRNSDLIRDIEIYFSNFDKPVNFSVKDVLPIIASYMPFDVIKKYYKYNKSEKILPDKENVEKTAYYIISYSLTSDASTAYYSGDHEYSGSIDVIITLNENKIVDSFRIGFGTPRWMSSLSMNEYYTKSWKCNLKDYLGG